jgi:hypothetical protein
VGDVIEAKAMVMALDPSYLAQADRHVAKLKALITDQEALIELLSAVDHSTQLAETLLGTMKDTLRLFEEHRRSMLTQIERRHGSSGERHATSQEPSVRTDLPGWHVARNAIPKMRRACNACYPSKISSASQPCGDLSKDSS